MTKLSKGAQDRLVNLLYQAGLVEVAPRIPSVSRFLYDGVNSLENGLPLLILNNLAAHSWDQKPFQSAPADLPSSPRTSVQLNILRFNCKSAYLSTTVFQNLYPIKRERLYTFPPAPLLESNSDFPSRLNNANHHQPSTSAPKGKETPTLAVVKARDPISLAFQHSYYLFFPSYQHAAVYWLETHKKLANGLSLGSLEFVKPTKSVLEAIQGIIPTATSNSMDFLDTVAENVGALGNGTNKNELKVVDPTQTPTKPPSNTSSNNLELSYDHLLQLSNFEIRQRMVLVRNLPFGIKNSSFRNVLWDYDLENTQTIISDISSQLHISVLTFSNFTGANRFVRNFHGRPWIASKLTEKKVYQALSCEIV